MWRVTLDEELIALVIRVDVWLDFTKRGDSSGKDGNEKVAGKLFWRVSCLTKSDSLSSLHLIESKKESCDLDICPPATSLTALFCSEGSLLIYEEKCGTPNG